MCNDLTELIEAFAALSLNKSGNSNDYCRTCYLPYSKCCCGTRKRLEKIAFGLRSMSSS